MEKISIQLTKKELEAVIDLMDYFLADAKMTGTKDEDEELWAFNNSILQKLKAIQGNQAQ